MKKLYAKFIFSFVLLSAILAFNGHEALAYEFNAMADTTKNKSGKQNIKITDTRTSKPDFLKSGIKLKFTPFKPLSVKPGVEVKNEVAQDDGKILSNVKVYPNPVQSEINLSYKVNKDTNVTIKIMDVLGNEISTLLSQKMMAGEQVNTFNISSRLNSGFYFIRLMVGNEIVVKRISVL